MGDEGYAGSWEPKVVSGGTLKDLRDIAGPAPVVGKKWIMVDLSTGEVKWYKSSRRRTSSYGGYNRRPYTRRR